MANVEHIENGGFHPIQAINNFFSTVSDSFAQSKRFQRTFDELNSLSARELADLGISRSDITRIAYDAVYKDEAQDYRSR